MEKLIIKDGIIQNKTINGLPVHIDIVKPSGNRNVRTFIPMVNDAGYTIHETGNTNPNATDTMHAKYFQNVENADKQYVGAHIFIDMDSYTQVLPINEVAFHAGDGHGNGNRKTISFEICINKNTPVAEYNTQYLVAMFLDWKYREINPHKHWSGKQCPRNILNEGRWDQFRDRIFEMYEKSKKQEDVSMWAIDAMRWAKNLGLTDGTGPKTNLTLERFITILYRYDQSKGGK